MFDLLDHVPCPLAFVSADDEPTVLYVNLAFTQLFGFTIDDVKSISGWTQRVYRGPDLNGQRLSSWLAAVEKVRRENDPVAPREGHVQCKDGTYRDVTIQTSLLLDLILLTFSDITQRKRVENELLDREKQFRRFVESANDIIYTLALDGRFLYVSPNIQSTLGLNPEDIQGTDFRPLVHPQDLERCLAAFVSVAQHGQRLMGVEYRVRKSDGTWGWQESNLGPILDDTRQVCALIGVGRDISEHKRYEAELRKAKEATATLNRALQSANERLERMATIDTLTGLWNRRYFEDRVNHEMAIANRYGHPLSILIFDIDRFKRVNDLHGHLAGDQVLAQLSARARQHIRTTDLPCRWGGEEFMVLMPHTHAREAVTVAERLRSAFAAQPIAPVGAVTASFGVATYQPGESLDHWIFRVDQALYEAKESGRNAVRFAPAG